MARRVSAAVEETQEYYGKIQTMARLRLGECPPGLTTFGSRRGFPNRTALGHATVQVDGRDVENVAIELHPPQTLHGTVRIEGSGAAKPSTIFVDELIDVAGIDLHTDPKDDGSFDLADLGWARYRVDVEESARKQVYLKTLRYGTAESNDGTFTLNSNGIPLELELSTRGARISGTVMGKAEMPKVILIPDTTDAARREYTTRTAVFDQNGVFAIEAIAPGAYKLYAFENVPEGTWLDPDFLKEVKSSGVAFEAAEGDAKMIQIPLLGKAETDRILAKLGIE